MEKTFNGSHRNLYPNKYFEWWYFHFVTKNGKTLNLILHETDLFGLKHEPYASISILLKKGKPLHAHKRFSKELIKANTRYLQLKNKEFFETKKNTKISIYFDDEKIKFNATIKKLSNPLVINRGLLFENTKGKSFWVVQIPYASFKGSIEINGLKCKLEGMAYQDHQWGNLPVQNFVSNWVWGNFSNKDQACIFFKIKTINDTLIERFAIVNTSLQTKINKVNTSFLNNLVKTKNPEKINTKSEIETTKNERFYFDVSPDWFMRKRINEKLPGFTATYLRWRSKAQYQSKTTDTKTLGIVEYLKIDK